MRSSEGVYVSVYLHSVLALLDVGRGGVGRFGVP
jgi:hypothetical protein